MEPRNNIITTSQAYTTIVLVYLSVLSGYSEVSCNIILNEDGVLNEQYVSLLQSELDTWVSLSSNLLPPCWVNDTKPASKNLTADRPISKVCKMPFLHFFRNDTAFFPKFPNDPNSYVVLESQCMKDVNIYLRTFIPASCVQNGDYFNSIASNLTKLPVFSINSETNEEYLLVKFSSNLLTTFYNALSETLTELQLKDIWASPLLINQTAFSSDSNSTFYSNDNQMKSCHLKRLLIASSEDIDIFTTDVAFRSVTVDSRTVFVYENDERGDHNAAAPSTTEKPLTKHHHHGGLSNDIIAIIIASCGGGTTLLTVLLCYRRIHHFCCTCCSLCREGHGLYSVLSNED